MYIYGIYIYMYLCSFDVFYFAVAALKSFLKHTTMAALKKLFDQPSTHEGHNDSSVRGIGFLNTYRFEEII